MIGTAGMQEFLRDIDYPEDTGAIVKHAQSRGAPQGVIDMLRKLPDRMYGNAAEINQAIGDIE